MRSMRPGLFADDSIIRRVSRENVLMLGGGRALLMQLAHPKVAAGVDEHSDFRQRPLYRLRRTVRLTMAIVFGDRDTALAAARNVNRVHARVKGRDYRALDPDLLLWVHATLVDSALVTYETFVRPLSSRQCEDFYQQMNVAAELLGVPSTKFPPTFAAFSDYVEDTIATELRVGDVAVELSRLVLRPRVMRIPGVMFVPLEVITTGLLPGSLREQYGLRWGRAHQRLFDWSTRALPRVIAVTPPVLRVWPLPGQNVRLSPDFSLIS
ncbi:MAG TPA: oxygenase MpaB family protein [Candidatus Dormibacteraeota bacterium]|nr:oxygenase MpaB family protein [Candidatus Dormibacteraeota bacterium]